MVVNIYMDMVDRECNCICQAKFPFEYDDEEELRKGINCLNGMEFEGEDDTKSPGWEMYRQLLKTANLHLIQNLPDIDFDYATNIVDSIMDYELEDSEDATETILQLSAELNKLRGILKRTKYNGNKYHEYLDKIAGLYTKILQYAYEQEDNDILFDCDDAYVVEWEKEKVEKGIEVPTDLPVVKALTKSYIRQSEIEPSGPYGSISHPCAYNIYASNPHNPQPQIIYPNQDMTLWLKGKTADNFDLTDPLDREKWFLAVEECIDNITTIEDFYHRGIIRGNWLDNWKNTIKSWISFSDRLLIEKLYEDHIAFARQERDRLFGR